MDKKEIIVQFAIIFVINEAGMILINAPIVCHIGFFLFFAFLIGFVTLFAKGKRLDPKFNYLYIAILAIIGIAFFWMMSF